MKINGQQVIGNTFAYEGCHKIYICESKEDEEMMKEYGYRIEPIEELEITYKTSCPLKFIHNAKLTKSYVGQFEEAEFTYED